MKIFWPWRQKKPLALFEERVPWPGEDPSAKPLVFSSLGPPHEAHPKNAPGDFYVANGECMSCGAPHAVAPALMGWDGDPNDRESPTHCYFKKQPSEPWEQQEALDAIQASCCDALYYSGSDPEILAALRKNGNRHAIVRKRD